MSKTKLHLKDGENLLMNFSFEDLIGDVVCEVSQTLIPLGRSAVKWCYGFGRVEYRYVDEEKLYMWLIPTVPDVEGSGFKYYMVAVKFLDGVDRESYLEAAVDIYKKHYDLRKCDSGSIFVVSPKLRYTHICRLKHFGKKAYLKWVDLARGVNMRVRAFPIVAKTPEKAIHRILKFMYIFLTKRLYALAETVGVSPKLHDYSSMKLLSLITNNIIIVNRELVRKFIEYLCRLTLTLHEKLAETVKAVKIKASIIESLKQLGIPQQTIYMTLRKPINMILSIAKQWKVRLRARRNPKDNYQYGFKIIEYLKAGSYLTV